MNKIIVTLTEVADISRLRFAWDKIRKKGAAGGIDGVSISEFETARDKNLQELSQQILYSQYTPEPLQAVQIPKPGKTEKRQLGLPSLKDKIVQSSLASLLSDFYDPLFSNCSYAYRPQKGSVRAIGRVKDFLNRKNHWAAPVDIDNFFDTVNHETCISILQDKISDIDIIRLIRLYFSSGKIQFDKWQDTIIGIPQGGALSPVLSNVYLNELDQYLHAIQANFVRYADDIILFANTRQFLLDFYEKTRHFLESKLQLKLNQTSHPVMSMEKGFAFLGIYFHRGQLKIDFNRMDEKVEKIKYIMQKQKALPAVITEINDFFMGVQRHYARIIPDSYQLKNLESTVMDELAQFIANFKKDNSLSKKDCKSFIESLVFITEKSRDQKDIVLEKIVTDAFSLYEQQYKPPEKLTSKKSVESAIHAKRQAYTKKIATETELIITQFGHSLGYTKNKFTVRHKGQIVASIPKHRLKRIAIRSSGVNLSSNLIYQCCMRRVAIEFFTNKGDSYAMIYTPQQSISQSSEIQLKARNTEKGTHLAYFFIKGKAKTRSI
ncbi:MAG: RNA-directed DNA polymerase [Candidatus Magnetoglobus multicellularis str. Araruama]|uniref:RNA-directed DNA polymerase n=1 Tax=Candidatus Magnetoglobus multicellularis str. Araruama TaxID=890399 RepID=A0A1V1P378_9BACT|nr:MAG: RNA-directed DNA polymerase [Candidatus Magnetoglobus multicellularis str. Araruama]